MGRYGYVRLDTPILQPADLFLTRAGDQIVTRLFTFDHNGTQIALRPEFTSSALSAFIAAGRTIAARWQFGGEVFEAASDLDKQHFSVGAEAIGLASRLVDAELIAMALGGLRLLGIEDGHVQVGHTALLRRLIGRHVTDSYLQRLLLNHAGLLTEPDGMAIVLDKLDRLMGRGSSELATPYSPSPAIMESLLKSLEDSQLMGGRTREDIQRRLQRKLSRGEARPQIQAGLAMLQELANLKGSASEVMPALRRLTDLDDGAKAVLDDWDQTLHACEILGVAHEQILLRPALSRNWDYYSGLVFELHGGGHHLGGGGRYDELARLLGSREPIPAVGFAYYMNELMAVAPEMSHAVRLWTFHAAQLGEAEATWLMALRSGGIGVRFDADSGELGVSGSGDLIAFGLKFSPSQVDEAIAWLEARS